MSGGAGAFEVIACGLRPEGSLVHLAVMLAFVWLAWRFSPASARARQ